MVPTRLICLITDGEEKVSVSTFISRVASWRLCRCDWRSHVQATDRHQRFNVAGTLNITDDGACLHCL